MNVKNKNARKLLVLVLSFVFAFSSFGLVQVVRAEDITELQFWSWRPEDKDFYDEVIADFEAENPDIKITQNAIKNTEYNTILSAALSAGDSAPDVFMARAYGGLQTYADSGYLLALDEYLPELEDFSETVRGGAISITDGKMYGVPAVSQTMFCFYNKAIYEELGLEIPTTWQEFLDNLAACQEAGYEALANGTQEGWCVETLFGCITPSFYAEEDFFNKVTAGETDFTDPVFVNALDKMTELIPYLPDMYEGVAYTDMQVNFINEISAHLLGGSYEAGYFKSENPDLDFGIFAVPGETEDDPAYVSVYADMNFGIAKETPHQEEALRFVKYLATPEFGQRIVEGLQMVTSVPNVDTSANPYIENVLELQEHATPYLFLVGFVMSNPLAHLSSRPLVRTL